jgi:hypothetical protein
MKKTLTPTENMALALVLLTDMPRKEIAEACYISHQKLTGLLKSVEENLDGNYGKKINKNYILSRDGFLFSLLTNTWITKTDSGCYRMNINGNRVKKSASKLLQKHFGKNSRLLA